MNKHLLTQALIKFLAGILLIGLLVFLPAGSVAYWQGWLLMGVLFVPMFIAGIVMLVKSPDLFSIPKIVSVKAGKAPATSPIRVAFFCTSCTPF